MNTIILFALVAALFFVAPSSASADEASEALEATLVAIEACQTVGLLIPYGDCCLQYPPDGSDHL